MIRRLSIVMLVTATIALGAPAVLSQPPTKVKLATLAPDGSVWHKALRELEVAWSKGTQGRVVLQIYPGGVAGDEVDMVRKMRNGTINAAAITAGGLTSIDEAFQVFGIPMFFESYPELMHVLQRMDPLLRKRLEAKGFVLLNWGHGGWAHIFSKQPITGVADLKQVKTFISTGDDRMVQLWKSNGFQPVALAATDILPGLQTGMIDVLPTTPLAALYLQWFHKVPYMVDTGLGPLVGGLVITRKAWDKIAEADRLKLLEACRRTERQLAAGIPQQDSTAVVEMSRRGLKVTRLTPERAREWRAAAETFAAKMRGSIVPSDILDIAVKERDAFRQQNAAKGSH